ncbi:RHS repeat-associated core domain-containing protein [Pseudomonas synxantha]
MDDTRRGALSYRYDPLGRLLSAQTISGEETFAFDPASNLLDPQAPRRPNQYGPNKLLDNLLRDYVGTHYSYDERGNLKERLHNGKKSHFTWDLYDRLIGYADDRLTVSFAYDALGRRLFKLSKAKYHDRREAGPMWNKLERAKLDEQYGCGYTIYGWDGDLLAFESRNNDKSERLTHYFFEPGGFVPVAQAVEQRSIQLLPEPVYEGAYDIDRDPVWQHKPKPVSFSALAWYQCDHLGTPMELTDEQGDIAWAGVYKAWGRAKEQRSETAKRADIRNPLRFQGQYFDVETGLHYNRYRYYDPQVGRFIGKDPIGFAGGLNVYAYAPNPVEWADPFGLARIPKSVKQKVANENKSFFGVETCESCITEVVPGQKSVRGVTPPTHERQFDHIDPDSLGGANDESNTQLLCRKCNRDFSNSPKPDFRIINRAGRRP